VCICKALLLKGTFLYLSDRSQFYFYYFCAYKVSLKAFALLILSTLGVAGEELQRRVVTLRCGSWVRNWRRGPSCSAVLCRPGGSHPPAATGARLEASLPRRHWRQASGDDVLRPGKVHRGWCVRCSHGGAGRESRLPRLFFFPPRQLRWCVSAPVPSLWFSQCGYLWAWGSAAQCSECNSVRGI